MNTNRLYFTSDTHFGHNNIIDYQNRPFKDADEMDETLIENWNRVVPENGIVYHLGDFALSSSERAGKILDQLNGREIYLIKGNHEHSALALHSNPSLSIKRFSWIRDYFELKVSRQIQLMLFHYSMRVWNKSHHGSWHLYGHSHCSLPSLGKSLDVGVDNPVCNYSPFTFDMIETEMNKKQLHEIDHHISR